MIGVVVVDDHPVVLAGLTALIEADPEMSVLGKAETFAAALLLPAEPKPDVCVLDLHLPDGTGLALAGRLTSRWPATKVVILTMSSEPATVLRSLAAGADSYLLKDAPPDELLGAIRATAYGSAVLSAGVSSSVRVAAAAVPGTGPLDRLDARDREILALMVSGLSAGQVGARLFLAPKTIRNRVSEMLTKLGVATREEAIEMGRVAGLRPPPGDASRTSSSDRSL